MEYINIKDKPIIAENKIDLFEEGMIVIRKDKKPFFAIAESFSAVTFEMAKMIDRLSLAIMEYKKQKETTLESYYDWFALLPYYKTEDKSFVAIIDKSNTENIALAKTLETVSFAIAEYAKQTEKKLIPKNYIEWLEILSFLEKKNKGNAEEPKCDFS